MPFILALFRERSTLMPKLDGKESNENLIHLREILEAQLSYCPIVNPNLKKKKIKFYILIIYILIIYHFK